MIDWSINLGNILTIGTLICSIAVFIMVIKDRVDALSKRMLLVEKKVDSMTEILVEQGRHEERMTAMDGRITRQAQAIDQLGQKLDRFFEPRQP